MFGFHLQVTPKGRSAFGELSSNYSRGYAAQVKLNGQYPRTIVEITGIADYTPPMEGWSGKEVRFTWQWKWNQFPDMAQHCFSPRSAETGSAAFRHYDDGWRVETIDAD